MEPVYECPRGCHKYSKPVSEIVQAASKHREAALSLKEICDKQKIKLKEYRVTIEDLKMAQQQHDEYTRKMSQENRALESEVILLKQKLKDQTKNHNSSEEASKEENEENLSRRD